MVLLPAGQSDHGQDDNDADHDAQTNIDDKGWVKMIMFGIWFSEQNLILYNIDIFDPTPHHIHRLA